MERYLTAIGLLAVVALLMHWPQFFISDPYKRDWWATMVAMPILVVLTVAFLIALTAC